MRVSSADNFARKFEQNISSHSLSLQSIASSVCVCIYMVAHTQEREMTTRLTSYMLSARLAF